MVEILIAVIGLIVWIGVLAFFRYYRIWLPFYILGSVGLAIAIIYFGRNVFPVEHYLKLSIGESVDLAGELVGMEIKLFRGVPGALLVAVVSQPIGWTMVQIDIECSGLLESAVLTGLLAFYPGFNVRSKLVFWAVGIGGTYIANIARLLVIITVLHWGGKDTLFITHTIIGRGVFFAIMIAVYWIVVTRPTIATVARQLGGTRH